ncbi:ABC transporter, permease protein (cluster 3, basic aa/glutamine/opines) [Olavius algarvensis Delta 1 endosymbiont]|nr:ABC transporter, permease protein (cluster 3, basic aa/glutamine/opines) [Olavius algarvensis Delta 1 endosymbiont]
MYEWDFSVIMQNYHLLLWGLLNTLKVTVVALSFGIPIGLLLALLRLSSKRWVSMPVGLFIEFFRSTPPLAQLFWIFFALPIIIDVEIDPYTASVLTFSIQSSAFFAEVFRAGIISLEKGQWEAGYAIGMQRVQVLKRIILPQAVKRMIPAFLERIIELMKTTTLVSAISYSDLLFQANAISQLTYRPLEVFTAAAAMYFMVLFPTSVAVRKLERRLAVSGESTAH